jgi:hypothetical protein
MTNLSGNGDLVSTFPSPALTQPKIGDIPAFAERLIFRVSSLAHLTDLSEMIRLSSHG